MLRRQQLGNMIFSIEFHLTKRQQEKYSVEAFNQIIKASQAWLDFEKRIGLKSSGIS